MKTMDDDLGSNFERDDTPGSTTTVVVVLVGSEIFKRRCVKLVKAVAQ